MKIIYRLRAIIPCLWLDGHETVGIPGARESDMGKTVAYNFFLSSTTTTTARDGKTGDVRRKQKQQQPRTTLN